MKWNNNVIKPKEKVPVLICLANGEIHEGHYIKDINKYRRNVNVWRIFKTGKCVQDEDVIMWANMPKVYLHE